MRPLSNAQTRRGTSTPQNKPKREVKPLPTIQPIKRMLGKNSMLPEKFDLSDTLSPHVKNQGRWESCTAFVACAAVERLPHDGPDDQDQSERFIWYNAKLASGKDPAENAPVNLKDAIEALQVSGSCRESSWPYYDANLDPKPWLLAIKPSERASEEALKMRVKAYQVDANPPPLKNPCKCQVAGFYTCQRDMIKQVLYFARLPVLTSLHVTKDTLFKARDPDPAGRRPAGALKFPRRNEMKNLTHAVLIVGYDEKMNMFKFRNSHGKDWGDHGYGYIPFKYLELAADFYVLYNQEYDPKKGSAAGSCMGSSSKEAPGSLPDEPLSEFFNITPK